MDGRGVGGRVEEVKGGKGEGRVKGCLAGPACQPWPYTRLLLIEEIRHCASEPASAGWFRLNLAAAGFSLRALN